MSQWDQLDLDRWTPRLRWAATQWAYRLFPRLAITGLEISASGLQARRIPNLFSQALRQIPPSLNDDLLDLFGHSERTLANQFTFLTESETFSAEIAWERHPSPAWRAELHAFDYALDLALNYRITGEERYARHLRYLLADWIASNPPGQGSGWLLPALARRTRNWVLAADLARQDWERDSTFFNLVANSLALQASFLHQHAASLRSTDDALDAARALLLAGVFFARPKGSEFRAAARALLQDELARRFTHEGRYTDSRPGSQVRLARTLAEFLAFGSPDDSDRTLCEEKLYEVLKVIEGSLLADGTLPLFGAAPASSGDDLADLFALAAVFLNEPMWKDLAGKFGIFPYMVLGEPGKAHFEQLPDFPWEPRRCLQPPCGLYRLSLTADSTMLINGRLPCSARDHQDGLSYELALRGQRAIVDSGDFPQGSQAGADYFASAAAHNILIVDGQAPKPVRAEQSLLPAEVVWEQEDRTIGLRVEHPGFVFAGLNHQRAWYCLDGQAWAVVDGVQGGGTHSLTSLIHLYPTFEVELKGCAARVHSLSLAFAVFPLGHPAPKLSVARGDQDAGQGWYAPAQGMKYSANVLRLEWEKQAMPWAGGYLIVPEISASFQFGDTDPVAGSINFRLGDREYHLAVRRTVPGEPTTEAL